MKKKNGKKTNTSILRTVSKGGNRRTHNQTETDF